MLNFFKLQTSNFKRLALLFILTMSVFNCEKNNLDVPSEDTIKILHSKGTTIDYLSNEQIPEVINTITSITGKETLSKSLQMKGVVYNKAYIDFNKVLKVKSEDDIVNYTFNVYLENSPSNEFYNLIVTEDAQGVISKPYIIKYVLDSDAVEVYLANNRDFNYFKGKRHIMSFDDFFGNLDFNLGKSSVVLRCSEDEKPIDNTYSDDNDGDFYAIPSGNILQTNSGGYTYAQSQNPVAGYSHRLSLSTYNINTNQYFNSYAATVTNPVSTITAGGVQLTINTNISSQTISTAPSIISVQVTAYTTVTSSGGSSDGGPTGATFTGYTEITYKYSNGDTVVKIINTTSSKQSEIKGVDCPEASRGIIGLSDDSIEENISGLLGLSRYNNTDAWEWLIKNGHPGVSTFKLLPLYNFLAENTNENGVVSAEAVEVGNEFINILIEFPNAKIERYLELKELLNDNPWALIQDCVEQNGLDIANYQYLYNHTLPQSCQDRLDALPNGFQNQPLNTGNAAVANVDYYPVEITTNPDFNDDGIPDSNEEVYNQYRANFSNLASGSKENFQFSCKAPWITGIGNTATVGWEFTPFITSDYTLWFSNNPLTTIFEIDAWAEGFPFAFIADDGAIMISEFTSTYWIGSTIATPATGTQPFSGNRQWGYITNLNGNLELYARAVDVARVDDFINMMPTSSDSPEDCQEDTYYNIGEATWSNLQEEIAQWVIDNDGQATVVQKTAIRFDKTKLKEVLESNESIDQIPCN